jgi:hypothetical protein
MKYSFLFIGYMFFCLSAEAAVLREPTCRQARGKETSQELEARARECVEALKRQKYREAPQEQESESERTKRWIIQEFDRSRQEQRQREIREFCERNPSESFCR